MNGDAAQAAKRKAADAAAPAATQAAEMEGEDLFNTAKFLSEPNTGPRN